MLMLMLGGGWCLGLNKGESKRRNREGRERRFRGKKHNKILLLFYNTVNNAILCLELYCSSIAKKFAILLFNIPQYRWFLGLKFQISLRFDINILQY